MTISVSYDAKDGIEPSEYFLKLKGKISQVEMKQLEKNRDIIAKELQKAHDLGQKNVTHKSAYMWEVVEREFTLHTLGYVDYVLAEDVTAFIDKVTPRNSIKIIELERFPRLIPDENAADIKKAMDLDIFDNFIVVYTDFADEEVSTPAEKEFVARNTDPIVFGAFINDRIGIAHSRMYLITDWEDEYCDLTYAGLIDKMSKNGIKNPDHKISIDMKHINKLAAETINSFADNDNKDRGLFGKWLTKLRGR